jgi:TolB-like protein/DNA-binding winged helix-turn-helix (wHTH) protein
MDTAGRVVRFGPFEIELRTGELRKHGTRIRLQEQAFRVLITLLDRPGEVVSREELARTLWSTNTFVDAEHGLNSAVMRLRQALGDSAEKPRFIETVARRGYRFLGPVTVRPLAEPEAPAARVDYSMLEGGGVSAPKGDPAAAALPSNPTSRRYLTWKKGPVFTALIAILMSASSGVIYVTLHRPSVIQSIAVLPFANTAADPDTDFLSDGITHTLINDLTQLPSLRVMARSTVFRYKDRQTDPAAVGRELGVAAVVTGQVERRKDQLLIRANLINVTDGSQIWGERYDRSASDVLAIQDEIASHIGRSLRLKLTREKKREPAARGTTDYQAYEYYLRGLNHLNKRNELGFRKGIEYFTRATERDPKYALAFSGLALCHALLANYYLAPAHETHPRAEAAARQAIALDETLAEAHGVLGMKLRSYDWNWAAAEAELRRALELDPSYAPAHVWYAESIALVHSPEAGVAAFRRALHLEPISLLCSSQLGCGLYWARRYGESIEQLKTTVELDPNYIYAHYRLVGSYLKARMFGEAIAEARRVLTLSGDPRHKLLLAQAYAMTGKRQHALDLLAEVGEFGTRQYVSPVQTAKVYIALQDKAQAIQLLEQALALRCPEMMGLVDPVWDLIRSEPRFRALGKQMRLPW